MSTYNGWTNWETWKTNLELVDGMTGEDVGMDVDMDKFEAGELLKDHCMEIAGQWETNSFVSGIVWEFFLQVDWPEIAEHLLSEMKEEESEE